MGIREKNGEEDGVIIFVWQMRMPCFSDIGNEE